MTLLAALPGAASTATPARTTSWSARPVADRTRPEIEGLIGFFVNTLVLRADLLGRSDLPRAAGAGARGGARRLRPPGRCRSSSWSRSSQPEREPRPHAALPGDVRAAERAGAASALALPGLSAASRSATGRSVAKFDLTLSPSDGAGGALAARLDYSTDLFDAATVERLAGHLRRRCSAALAADPARACRRAAAARRRRSASSCSAAWNATARRRRRRAVRPRPVRRAGRTRAGRRRRRLRAAQL